MCGRYSFIVSDDLGRRFRVFVPTLNLRSRFNVTPGQEMPVVFSEDPAYRMELMTWGLVPSWSKDPAIGRRLINARAETLAEKPAFRGPFKKRRCIVPASGFYEWKKVGEENIPYYYHLKGAAHFGFAGLYDVWNNPSGAEVKTYIIITTDANELVSLVHDRMPAILDEDDEDEWLSPATGKERLEEILQPFTNDRLEAYPVSKKVNNPANDSEELIKPVSRQNTWW